jgi:hypothetical protein
MLADQGATVVLVKAAPGVDPTKFNVMTRGKQELVVNVKK